MGEITYGFGLVGLGVMGRNFILNVAKKGFAAYGHDLDEKKVGPIPMKEPIKKVFFTQYGKIDHLLRYIFLLEYRL